MGIGVGGTFTLPDVSSLSPQLQAYVGQPSVGSTGVFKNAMASAVSFVGNVAGGLASNAAGPFAGAAARDLVKSAGSVLTGSASSGLGGGFGNAGDAMESLQGLLEQQIAVQAEMQAFTMQTNIEHSKHETKMAAVRNMRVG